jgi:hypothetical protein
MPPTGGSHPLSSVVCTGWRNRGTGAAARHACALSGRGLTADEWNRYIPELPYRATCRL